MPSKTNVGKSLKFIFHILRTSKNIFSEADLVPYSVVKVAPPICVEYERAT